MSFLAGFSNVLHALEVGAKCAAPFVAMVNPPLGALILQATSAAITIEAALPQHVSGSDKAALLLAQTEATVASTNQTLLAAGQPPLPEGIAQQAVAKADLVIKALIAQAAMATRN